MPKVRTCKYKVAGVEFTAELRVDSKGKFSITRPKVEGERESLIIGTEAESVERQWCQAVRDYSSRTRQERKVIAVKFDSELRPDGVKSTFDAKHMLLLKCRVCLEVTTIHAGETKVELVEHPDFKEMHGPKQPFPWFFLQDLHRLNFDRSNVTIVEWTQEIETALVNACAGIQAVVNMLDQVLSSPESIIKHIANLATLTLPHERTPEQASQAPDIS